MLYEFRAVCAFRFWNHAYACLFDRCLTRSGIPAWKRLTDRPLAADECISLITDLFSDRSEIEVVKRLRGDDAQSFVDVTDKVLTLPHFHLRGVGPLTRVPNRH